MLKLNVTGCSNCPFNYDFYTCQHPSVSGDFGKSGGLAEFSPIGEGYYPPLCPMQEEDVKIHLNK